MTDSRAELSSLSAAERATLEQNLLDRLARRDVSATTIPPHDPAVPLPLSFAQQRLWLIDQLSPGQSTYNVGHAFRLRGPIDLAAIERTLAALVERHEPLRTVFRMRDGEPVQVIQPEAAPVLVVMDLSHLAAFDRDQTAYERIREEVNQPFDLALGPLLRARVLRLTPVDHILAVTVHHIATDGWSERVFWKEFVSLYEGFATGQPISLPALPVRYADFTVWQRTRLSGKRLTALLDYWLASVGDLPPLDLPTDFPRSASITWPGDGLSFTLPAELAAALRRLSEQTGSTLYTLLLAAFQLLLYRTTGQELFALGTPVASRNRLELEPLVGFFVNTLVLRADLSGDLNFLTLLDRVRHNVIESLTHQELPFERLVQELSPQRESNRQPVFQVMFQMDPRPASHWQLPGIKVEPVAIDIETAKFDLLLSMSERGDELSGRLAFATDLFERASIERLLARYTSLLSAIADDPARPLSHYPLLTPADRQQLIVDWNDTAVDYPRDASLAELFERKVARQPDAPALLFGTDGVVSYAALNRQANRIARALQQSGVGPNSVVGLALGRSPDLIAAILGTLKAGGAYLPLETYTPAARLQFLLADAGAHMVLVGPELEPVLSGSAVPMMTLESLVATDAEGDETNPPPAASGSDLAYIMYTSGSTGMPKGVEIRQRSVSRLVHGVDYVELGPQETLLQLASPAFDVSTFEIWGALLHGSPLVVAPDGLPDLTELDGLIKRWNVSTLWLTAGLFNSVIDIRPQLLSSVRQVITGGEALSVAHVRQAQHVLPGTQFVNGYGPTENTTFTCCHPIPRPLPDDLASIPIGRPVPNTQVYVLDSRLEPVPVGIVGELYAGGDGVARGYLNRTELNAERFIDSPFAPGERLYRSGDRVRWLPDGTLDFIGRVDNQIKLRGFRIEPGEVQVQLDRHPAILRTAVGLISGPGGERQLAAWVVAAQDQAPQAADLREWLLERLPYYMIPAVFVLVADLPLTSSGKVDHQQLGKLEPLQTADNTATAPKFSPEERVVADIFGEVLDRGVINQHDDFFLLGGHSLLAIQVTNRLASQLDVDVPLGLLFEQPTVAGLAKRLVALQREGEVAGGEVGETATTQRPLPLTVEATPRTSLEDDLAIIWQRVLNVDHVGVDDDFFALGGHSLTAVQLVDQIEQAFDRRLPAALLFDAPTIAAMAKWMQQPAEHSDILVPIQTGGQELPLFCVHGFGGGVMGYADLAKALQPDLPVYGLQAAGLAEVTMPDDTIEAMARRYVAAVRARQPAGPYHLGGYCYGGIVAFEMARQLEADGETVGLLAIIEGYAPERFQQRLPAMSRRRWLTVWHNVPYWLEDYWSLGVRSVGAQVARKARIWFRAVGRPDHTATVTAQDVVPHDLSALPQHHRQVMEQELIALRNYAPQPINGPITLFAAEGKTISAALFGTGDPHHGWSALTRSGVTIRMVPGGHRNLHLTPHAVSLAAALKAEMHVPVSATTV